MPSRPDFSEHRRNPRFDRYRDRVGRLYRGEEDVGSVLVVVVPYAPQVGGHLWWTRWGSTRDWLFEWTVVDGNWSDTLVPEDMAGEVVAGYAPAASPTPVKSCKLFGRMVRSPSFYAAWSSASRCRSCSRHPVKVGPAIGPGPRSPSEGRSRQVHAFGLAA